MNQCTIFAACSGLSHLKLEIHFIELENFKFVFTFLSTTQKSNKKSHRYR